MYPFSKAGEELRKLIFENKTVQLGACIIPTEMVMSKSNVWVAQVKEPSDLSSLWIKVAGSIVILPNPDSTNLLSLYDTWHQSFNLTDFGLKVKEKVHFKVTFNKQDIAEAQKDLPTFFKNNL